MWGIAVGALLFAPPSPRQAVSERAPSLEVERGTAPRAEHEYGPVLPPEFDERPGTGEVELEFRKDGSVEAHMPRAVRVPTAVCALGLCLGWRTSSQPDQPAIQLSTAPILVGLVGKFGYQPPTKAPAMRVLRQTFSIRVSQGAQWRSDQLERAHRELGQQLARVLADDSMSLPERRALIFAWWEEARLSAEQRRSDVDDPLEDERIGAARAVASTIERFVRLAMPKDSPNGYPPRELARLNARRSCAADFDPYGDGLP